MNDTPCITAVMPTSAEGVRRRLATVSIACFLNQTYPNKHLLILNHGEQPLLTAPMAHVRELQVIWPGSLGCLRNRAFEHIFPADLMMSWDDDDWHHPERMAYQFEELKKSGRDACVLRRYTTVNLNTGQAFVRDCRQFRCRGACGVILCKPKPTIRYPAVSKSEDSEFAMGYASKCRLHVADNPAEMYLRSCHDDNTTSPEKILRPSLRAVRELTGPEIDAVAVGVKLLREAIKSP